MPKQVSIEVALGEVIQEHRKRAKLSQEELAFRSGLHRTFISQIERGLKSPSVRNLLNIARALHCRADMLVRELESRVPEGQSFALADERSVRRSAVSRRRANRS